MTLSRQWLDYKPQEVLHQQRSERDKKKRNEHIKNKFVIFIIYKCKIVIVFILKKKLVI